jgi:serine/threonine protein kinase
VKLAPDGKVKVLDFGLAKAWAGRPTTGSSSDLSQSPTLAHSGTQAGVILGTAACMSPEQARGKPVDKRGDIWAFGALLFEMLTGQRHFFVDEVSDTLASVLKDEPDWTLLPLETPGRLSDLLRRCMRKDARNRLRDIGDARIEIEKTIDGDRDEAPAGHPATRPSASQRALPWTIAGAAILTLGLVLAFLVP